MAIQFHPKSKVLVVAFFVVLTTMSLEIRSHYPEIKASIEKDVAPAVMKSAIYETLMVRENLKTKEPTESAHVEDSKIKTDQASKLFDSDLGKTTALLVEAVQLDRNNVKALALLSGIRLNEGNKEEARNLAMDCITVDRKNSECYANLIGSFTRFGDFDASYQFLTDCIQSDPTNIYCLGGLTVYYLHANRFQEAKETVIRIEQQDPNSVWAFLAKAQFFEATGDPAQAKEMYARACKMGQEFACSKAK
jgi:Tfp pilus assembly protein PilF